MKRSSLVLACLLAALAPAHAQDDGFDTILAAWSDSAAQARASQPAWSSPLATTTAMLEQRFRFDADAGHSGNGTDTTVLDGGKGLDLIVSDTNEIQIATPAYDIRSGAPATSTSKAISGLSGFADGTFLRAEQRLASSPADGGNYVVTAWLQIQAPTGIAALTNNAWTYLPTLAAGKGWGDFDVQATIGGVLPASHTATLGQQIQTNIAFQYHVAELFWPELEVNSTYYAGGPRNGLNQIYMTPGLVVGRFSLSQDLKFTCGVGYQIAISPSYRAKPLTPAYNDNWLFTTRLNF